MSKEIFQGSNNVMLSFVVSNDNGVLNLADATVTLLVSLNGVTKQEKPCVIDDASNGECSVILVQEDLLSFGRHRHQLKIEYSSGDLYYTNMEFFDTLKKIEPIPVV